MQRDITESGTNAASIMLLGFGASMDLSRTASNPIIPRSDSESDRVTVFVLDSSRPINLKNVYAGREDVVVFMDDMSGYQVRGGWDGCCSCIVCVVRASACVLRKRFRLAR